MVRCCVLNCKSRTNKKLVHEDGQYVSFHEFPCDLTLRQQWLKAISREDFVINDKSNSSRVCSKHFKKEDFNYGMKRRLKAGSIPSIFNGTSSALRELKYLNLEPTKLMKIQRNQLDLTFKTESEHIVPTLQEELNRKELYVPTIQEESSRKELNVPTIQEELRQKELAIPSIQEELNSKERRIRFMRDTLMTKELALYKKSKLLEAKKNEIRKLKKQLLGKSKRIQNINERNEAKEKDLNYYKNNIYHQNLKKLLDLKSSGRIEQRQLLLLTQIKFIFKKLCRWPRSVLSECVQLQEASPDSYSALIKRNLVTLPSRSTLFRYKESVANVPPPVVHKLQDEVPEESFCALEINEAALTDEQPEEVILRDEAAT